MPHRSAREDRLIRFLGSVPAFRDKVEAPSVKAMLVSYAASIGIAAVATLLRAWLDPHLPPGFPYLTFFPAVIITGFVFGLGPAVLSALLCGLAAWYWFIAPVESFGLSAPSMVALAFFVVVVTIDLGVLQLALAAYRSQARAKASLEQLLEVQETVTSEVDHRMKNLLATVSGLIGLSRRHAETPEALAKALQSRLAAMGEAVRLLRASLGGQSSELHLALAGGLQPLGIVAGERLSLEGPVLPVGSSAVVALSLIVHELGTNAIKYGALSQPRGQVAIRWRETSTPEGAALVELNWTERGGPAVAVPTRSGFGSDLITRMAASLGGEARFDYAADGVLFTITMLRDQLAARAE